MIVRLVALAALLALVAGIVLAWPQISGQLGINASSPESTPATNGQATGFPSGEASEAPTGEPSDDPTPAPTEAPTPDPTPEPSFWTSGHPDPDNAIEEFIAGQGFTYGGACETASSGDYCSMFVADAGTDLVYAVGPLESEAEVWVLLHQIEGDWYVADLASAADGSPAPW
jgi:cell wall-associated NlpC family hydrolase